MKKKLFKKDKVLTVCIWILLLAVFVLAVAPTIPPTVSPANETIFFSDPLLTCSGSTDPEGDTIYYEFWNYTASNDTTEAVGETLSSTTNNAANYGMRIKTKGESIKLKQIVFYAGVAQPNCAVLNSSKSSLWAGTLAGGCYPNYILEPYTTYYVVSSGSGNIQYNTFSSYPIVKTYINYTGALEGGGGGDVSNRAYNIASVIVSTLGETPDSKMQNTTSTTYEWAGLDVGRYNWSCKACDNNSDCSNYVIKNLYKLNFTNCSSGNIALNITFLNEATGADLNATLNTLSFNFTSSGDDHEYGFSEATVNNSKFQFCLDPAHINAPVQGNIKYQFGDEFPLRTFYFDDIINGNNSYNQVLYLLDTDDGIYSTIQVQTVGGDPLEGVTITISRNFIPPSNNATYLTLSQQSTDGAGLATFWVNPNYEHRFAFSKAGYQSKTVSLTPSQETYTVQMSTSTVGTLYAGSTKGMLWDYYPGIGALNNGTYSFGVNVSATNGDLIGCKFKLYHTNDSLIDEIEGCTSSPYTGDNINVSAYMENGYQFRGEFWIKTSALCEDSVCSSGTNEGETCVIDSDCQIYGLVDGDPAWRGFNWTTSDHTAIYGFFKDLRTFNEFGGNQNEQEFSRIVWFFLIATIIIGVGSYFTGFDLQSPGMGIIAVSFLIVIGSAAGFFTISSPGPDWWDQWALGALICFVAWGWGLNELRRASVI